MTFSYVKMVASLSIAQIDLNWADNQYWTTLFAIIREKNAILKPKEKHKLSADEMQMFIR